ncbi:MAG: HK97 family phage prohead protease [Prevotellaceae bacterium]|jgi:HK97 family phage prohead protease|nr:HK97 family phage prohead protease [Prevotellaceae bacterium]
MNKDSEKLQIKRINTPAFCYKAFAEKVSVEKDSRIIKGYLASFDTKDDAGDILVRGCFAKSISEHGPESKSQQKIVHLWQHDRHIPLGKYLKLEEDETGLYFEAEFDNIPEADRAIEQYKSGTLNQHSFGYRYVWDKIEYSSEHDAFIVKEVILFEGSTVTFGCNPNTPFLGFGKSAQFNQNVMKSLEAETDITLAGLAYEKQLEIRKMIAKYQSLVDFKPIKESLKNESEPTKRKNINDLF